MTVLSAVASAHSTMRSISTTAGSVVTIASGAAGGSLSAGDIGGLLGGITAAVSLFVTVMVYNAKRVREYNHELAGERAAGDAAAVARMQPQIDDLRSDLANCRKDIDFWRGIAWGYVQRSGAPMPIPPSERSDQE